MENRGTKIRDRIGSTHSSGGARVGGKNKNRAVLLGGRHQSGRRPRKGTAWRRWLSGNDWLRSPRQSRAVGRANERREISPMPQPSEAQQCWLAQLIPARLQFPSDKGLSPVQ